MNSSNAEQLTDAEAAAALLALADPLIWDHSWDEEGKAYAKTGQSVLIYQIIHFKRWGERYIAACSYGKTNTRHPTDFTSNADARAACERHHATGKWE